MTPTSRLVLCSTQVGAAGAPHQYQEMKLRPAEATSGWRRARIRPVLPDRSQFRGACRTVDPDPRPKPAEWVPHVQRDSSRRAGDSHRLAQPETRNPRTSRGADPPTGRIRSRIPLRADTHGARTAGGIRRDGSVGGRADSRSNRDTWTRATCCGPRANWSIQIESPCVLPFYGSISPTPRIDTGSSCGDRNRSYARDRAVMSMTWSVQLAPAALSICMSSPHYIFARRARRPPGG